MNHQFSCTIIINAKEYHWNNQWITYDDILNLIGKKGNLTVVYHSKFFGNEHNGTIVKGDQLIAVHGMIIDAQRTDNT